MGMEMGIAENGALGKRGMAGTLMISFHFH